MTLKRSDIFDLKATALASEDDLLGHDGASRNGDAGYDGDQYDREDRARSEEHTSELQSQR